MDDGRPAVRHPPGASLLQPCIPGDLRIPVCRKGGICKCIKRHQTKEEQQKTLRRILHYIRPYTALVVLSLLLSALTVGLTLYIPILTGRGVDYIVGEGQVDFAGLMAVITGILLSIVVTAAAQWIMNHINNKITYALSATFAFRPSTICRSCLCPM